MDQPVRQPSLGPAIPFWRQMRWQLIITFMLLAVVPLILIETINYRLSRAAAETQAFNQLQSVADLKRDQIESWIRGSTSALSFLLSDPVRDRLIGFTRTAAPTADQQAAIDRSLV